MRQEDPSTVLEVVRHLRRATAVIAQLMRPIRHSFPTTDSDTKRISRTGFWSYDTCYRLADQPDSCCEVHTGHTYMSPQDQGIGLPIAQDRCFVETACDLLPEVRRRIRDRFAPAAFRHILASTRPQAYLLNNTLSIPTHWWLPSCNSLIEIEYILDTSQYNHELYARHLRVSAGNSTDSI